MAHDISPATGPGPLGRSGQQRRHSGTRFRRAGLRRSAPFACGRRGLGLPRMLILLIAFGMSTEPGGVGQLGFATSWYSLRRLGRQRPCVSRPVSHDSGSTAFHRHHQFLGWVALVPALVAKPSQLLPEALPRVTVTPAGRGRWGTEADEKLVEDGAVVAVAAVGAHVVGDVDRERKLGGRQLLSAQQ